MNKEHLVQYLSRGIKADGRKLTEYRKIEIEYDVSQTAEGSARVRIGETEVIAGVKLGVEKPYPDTPDQGNLMVGAELLPLSSPEYESGPPGTKAIETARVIDRGIRESHAIDTKALCVVKGEKVWSVMVDVCTINDAGNILDAGALAAMAALKKTRFPAYDGVEIDYREKTDKFLDVKDDPIAVTVYKVGEHLLVDPTIEEEEEYDARLTITSTKDGVLSALQKGGEVALTIDEIDRMVALGLEKGKEIRKLI